MFIDRFAVVVDQPEFRLFHWKGWEIVWRIDKQRGDLWTPEQHCAGQLKNLEALAAEAVRQEKGA